MQLNAYHSASHKFTMYNQQYEVWNWKFGCMSKAAFTSFISTG